MSDLYDEAMRASEETRVLHPCLFSKIYEKMTPEDVKSVRRLLKDPAITSKAIVKVLLKRGHHMTAPTATRHKRDDCLTCSVRFAREEA